ncbi:MAG: hypothetical protein ACRELB_08080, partial [Polyangiaceae bacterium]
NWAERFGGSGNTNATGVALDPTTGDILLAGDLTGSTDFGGGVLTNADAGAAGPAAAYVAKLDSSGSYKWAQAFSATGGAEGLGVAVDDSGNVLLGGQFGGTTSLGGGTVSSTGTEDIFLAKFNSMSGYIWGAHFGYAGNNVHFRGAAFGSSGAIYVVGEPEGTPLDLGCGAVPTGMTMFVAEFDTGGACVWSNAYASYNAAMQTNYTQSETLAIGPAGPLLVGGGFYGSVDFGAGALTAPGIGMDVFVQKLSLNGTVAWAKAFGSGGSVAQVTGIAADACGNILVDGTFSQTLDFGCGTLNESGLTGSGDIFLAKLDPSGNCLWSKSYGDPNAQHGGPLALDGLGGPVITGEFSGTVDFGGGTLNGAAGGSASTYIAKFTSIGTYEWAYAGGPPASTAANSGGHGVTTTATAVVAAGTFSGGTLSVAGDALTAVATGGNAYLASFTR